MKKKQLNGNVRPETVDVAKEISERTGLTLGDILETSVAFTAGSKNPIVEAKSSLIRKAYREGDLRPFELPLTPFENNALTAQAA